MHKTPLALNAVICDSHDKCCYTVKETLGSGGTGIAYKCLSSRDGYYYCIKELYPSELAAYLTRQADGSLTFETALAGAELYSLWEWYQDHFIQEAKIQQHSSVDSVADTNDPFFLRSFGAFECNGTYYAKYDIQKGIPFSKLLDDLPLRELLSLMACAAKKLDALHQKGILHLDICPSNLHVIEHTPGKELYFLDFGNSLKFDESTPSRRFSATDGYSPLELWAKSEGNTSSCYQIGPHTDTFSLTAVLFRALTGETYCADHSLNPEAWKEKIRTKTYECGANCISDSLIGILSKGLSSQENRYQTANALLQDLQKLNDVYIQISGNRDDLRLLLSDIQKRIDHYESLQHAEATKTKRFALLLTTCSCAVILLALLISALFQFCDFRAPTVTVQNIGRNETGHFIVRGSSLELVLKISDDKELEWHNITLNDLVFIGFSVSAKNCQVEPLSNDSYKLVLQNIQATNAEYQSIIIKGGCAEDRADHRMEQQEIPLIFVPDTGDTTIPTVTVTKPSSALVRCGESVSYSVYFDDETQLNQLDLSQAFFAAGFQYEKMDVVRKAAGMYTVQFFNIQGTNGICRMYVAPGAAIDLNGNYSKGIDALPFYLYDSEDSIDTVPPTIAISSPMVENSSVTYTITATDNGTFRSINLPANSITPVGFTAEIHIESPSTLSGEVVRLVRFSNISSVSDEMYFILNSGVVADSFGNISPAIISPVFSLPE